MIFYLDGDSEVNRGQEVDLKISGTIESVRKGSGQRKKITLNLRNISQIEGEIKKNRADGELSEMLPKSTVQWAVDSIIDAIAKTPAQHALDQMSGKS